MTPIGTGAGLIHIENFINALAYDVVGYVYKKTETLWEIVIVVDDELKFQ